MLNFWRNKAREMEGGGRDESSGIVVKELIWVIKSSKKWSGFGMPRDELGSLFVNC